MNDYKRYFGIEGAVEGDGLLWDGNGFRPGKALAPASNSTSITTTETTSLTLTVPRVGGVLVFQCLVHLANTAAAGNARSAVLRVRDAANANVTIAALDNGTRYTAAGAAAAFQGGNYNTSTGFTVTGVGAETTRSWVVITYVPVAIGAHILTVQGTDAGSPTGTFILYALGTWSL